MDCCHAQLVLCMFNENNKIKRKANYMHVYKPNAILAFIVTTAHTHVA